MLSGALARIKDSINRVKDLVLVDGTHTGSPPVGSEVGASFPTSSGLEQK